MNTSHLITTAYTFRDEGMCELQGFWCQCGDPEAHPPLGGFSVLYTTQRPVPPPHRTYEMGYEDGFADGVEEGRLE